MGAKGSKSNKNVAVLGEDEITLLLANTNYSREEIIKWHEGSSPYQKA